MANRPCKGNLKVVRSPALLLMLLAATDATVTKRIFADIVLIAIALVLFLILFPSFCFVSSCVVVVSPLFLASPVCVSRVSCVSVSCGSRISYIAFRTCGTCVSCVSCMSRVSCVSWSVREFLSRFLCVLRVWRVLCLPCFLCLWLLKGWFVVLV